MYIYFIAKKCKFLKVDRGIYFKSRVLKLTDIYQAKLIAQQTTVQLFSYRLVMLFCIGALMSNPTLFKLTKPTGGLRHTWFQIITRFLLCFAEDDRPCLNGLCLNTHMSCCRAILCIITSGLTITFLDYFPLIFS